jgi:hypothetical protein
MVWQLSKKLIIDGDISGSANVVNQRLLIVRLARLATCGTCMLGFTINPMCMAAAAAAGQQWAGPTQAAAPHSAATRAAPLRAPNANALAASVRACTPAWARLGAPKLCAFANACDRHFCQLS